MGTIIEIIFIIVLIIILVLQGIIRTISKMLINEENMTRLSGFEVAKTIAGDNVHIIKKKGKFLDYYDYERNVIKLSPEVFDGTNVFAAITAITVALEAKEEYKNAPLFHKIASFLVLASYIVIALGAFLSSFNTIYFGFILFILAFILELLILDVFGKLEKDLDNLNEYIKKQEVLKPYDEYDKLFLLAFVHTMATLPYSFIKYFR